MWEATARVAEMPLSKVIIKANLSLLSEDVDVFNNEDMEIRNRS